MWNMKWKGLDVGAGHSTAIGPSIQRWREEALRQGDDEGEQEEGAQDTPWWQESGGGGVRVVRG